MSLLEALYRMLIAVVQAQQMGHGGITCMLEITGLDRKTIFKGGREMTEKIWP